MVKQHKRRLIQRWIRITDAAMHETPRGFAGFKVSPAAFLINGVQNKRTPPDWFHSHEKRQERRQWDQERAVSDEDELGLRPAYDHERTAEEEVLREYRH